MRPFTPFEQKNLQFMSNLGIRYTTFQTYWTSLEKGYFDAIAPLRTFLLEEGIHDYACQGQGQLNKEYRDAYLLTETLLVPAKASLYRPQTKKGDPRIWFSRLHNHAQPDDLFVLFHLRQCLYIINITQTNIEECVHSAGGNPVQEILLTLQKEGLSTAHELLSKFKALYDNGRWYQSEVQADTGIGRAVETLLGIKMNGSKEPDYKGIELKSKRLQRSASKNGLFSQIPNWETSHYKSGKQIVQQYGYLKDGAKTLQITVQANKPNAQTLMLDVKQEEDRLEMVSMQDAVIADHIVEWQLKTLHHRLKTKHKETFWVSVDNRMMDGKEYFRYSYIEHTRNPNIDAFDQLIAQQMISLELLLSRPSGRGDTWNFKIKNEAMSLLFPEKLIYKLDPLAIPSSH